MTSMNENQIKSLLKRPGNNECADCGRLDPEYTAYNIGIFICKHCAVIHRTLGIHISKVKHLWIDVFEPSQLERLLKVGNRTAYYKWEDRVPNCYRKPNFKDNPILIEQWIRAKYVDEKFTNESCGRCYNTGTLVGYLFKRGKYSNKYSYHKFVLMESKNMLAYYSDEQTQKTVLKLSDLSISFSPTTMNNSYSFQLIHFNSEDNTFRHFFIYHNDASIIINWYMEIRCGIFHRLQVTFPKVYESDVLELLLTDIIKEGWLLKTGPRITDVFRKRWFTLDRRVLMYHNNPYDSIPKGVVFIGHISYGFSVRSGALLRIRDEGFSFTFQTPSRIYNLSADTEQERTNWLEVLDKIIKRPLTEYDNAVEERLRKRHG